MVKEVSSFTEAAADGTGILCHSAWADQLNSCLLPKNCVISSVDLFSAEELWLSDVSTSRRHVVHLYIRAYNRHISRHLHHVSLTTSMANELFAVW